LIKHESKDLNKWILGKCVTHRCVSIIYPFELLTTRLGGSESILSFERHLFYCALSADCLHSQRAITHGMKGHI